MTEPQSAYHPALEVTMRMEDMAKARLSRAGYCVAPADGVPGLFDVGGIGRDVTISQLVSLAMLHGR